MVFIGQRIDRSKEQKRVYRYLNIPIDFQQRCKGNSIEKEQVFQQIELLRKTGHQHAKKGTSVHTSQCIHINSEWIIDLNIKPKMIKLLEDDIEEKHLGIG